jgi:type IV secretion system protein TrbL
MGSAANTAFQAGRTASGATGAAGVAAGLGNVASTAGSATMQGARGALSRIARPFADSAARGRQAAETAMGVEGSSEAAGSGAAKATAPQGGSPANAAPAWARRLRDEQNARNHRHAVMQTIKDGDRPGGSANPDLSQKED